MWGEILKLTRENKEFDEYTDEDLDYSSDEGSNKGDYMEDWLKMMQTFIIESLNGLTSLELLGVLEDADSKEIFRVKEVLKWDARNVMLDFQSKIMQLNAVSLVVVVLSVIFGGWTHEKEIKTLSLLQEYEDKAIQG